MSLKERIGKWPRDDWFDVPHVEVAGEAWCWQWRKIRKLMRKLGPRSDGGLRTGFCRSFWSGNSDGETWLDYQFIEIIKIKPGFHKKLLKHEMTHWYINKKHHKDKETANRLNKAYDYNSYGTKWNLFKSYMPWNNDYIENGS